jgi:hypothetical protein
MNYNHLPSSVAALFEKLADEHGLHVGQPECSGSFDQLVQVAEAENLSIRFVRDRGDEVLEVGYKTNWFSPELMRLVLLGGEPQDMPADLQKDASFLGKNFDEIKRLFSAENRPETLQRLHDMRMKKARCMFPDSIADGHD